jgi:cytochrome P450 PksS
MTSRKDFISQDFFRNQADGIARLRARGPVLQVHFPIIGKVWITTTSDVGGRVLKDSETFTLRKADGSLGRAFWWLPPSVRVMTNTMLTMDEPDHTRLREIVDEAFRRRAILDMEPRVLQRAEGLADWMFADGAPADAVQRYARRLPLEVISELLGLPDEDRAAFTAWSARVTHIKGFMSLFPLIPAMGAMRRYLERRLDIVRAEGGEGLIAELVRAETEGQRISRDEMVAMVFLLLGAGTETTAHLISGSIYELARKPDLRDWLAADWDRGNLAVEEFLRYVSPVQFSKPRHVRKDVDLGGVTVKKGDRIMVMVAAANMDPAANQCPEKMDLERRPNRHLAFGTGIHFCLGHQLARIEGKAAMQALFTRWPQLELAVPETDVIWLERPGLNAIESLPVSPGQQQLHAHVRKQAA